MEATWRVCHLSGIHLITAAMAAEALNHSPKASSQVTSINPPWKSSLLVCRPAKTTATATRGPDAILMHAGAGQAFR